MSSLVAQRIKSLPAMQETLVWSLHWEDPLEKGMATHSSTLIWEISWTEEPGRPQSMGLQRVRHDWATNTHTAWWFDLHILWNTWASLVTQLIKNLPTVQKTWVRSLGWEYPFKKEMATHSSILAWEISWTEEPGRPQSMGLQRLRHDLVTKEQQYTYVYMCVCVYKYIYVHITSLYTWN